MADRYWVGGTANWDGTAGTKWATTSGGAGGASVPTSADDVFFDANSGTGTVTIAAGNTGAKSINCTGFTGTLVQAGAPISVAGSITLSAGMTYSVTGNANLIITGTGTLITAGKSLGNTQINGSGITVTLGDSLTLGTGRTLAIDVGTFNTANYTLTVPVLASSGTAVRAINLGSSTVNISDALGFTNSTNLTFNAGTSQINLTGITSFAGGSNTFYNVAFTNTVSGTRSITGANTFNNLSVTAPSSAGVAQVSFNSNQTINGTLSTTGTAGNRRVWFRSDTYGVRRTLTVNSAPSLTDADLRDIIVNGTAAPISGTRIGNRGACAGITFDAPKTVYWNLGGNRIWSDNGWASTNGGTPNTDNFPLAQDTAVINNTNPGSGSAISTDASHGYIPTIDLSARTVAITINIGATTTIYGNWINGSGVSLGTENTLTFEGQGTKTITSAGKTFSCPITINAYGGTVELADALNIGTNTLTVTNGTFDTKNYNVTAGALSSSNSNVRTINLGSSNVVLSASSTIAFNTSTNLTFNAGTSQIELANQDASINTGSGVVFNNVSFSNTTASGNRTITGANTFNNLSLTASGTGLSRLILFTNQTVNGTLTCAGSSATARGFVFSDTIGTTRTITANAISANDCDFRDITIAGSAAGASPTRAGDCGGNSGINFPAPKTVYRVGTSTSWGGAGTAWALSSGGTPSADNFPLSQDTAVFDDTTALTGTLSITSTFNIGSIDCSTRTTGITLNFSATQNIYGNFTLGSGVTVSGTGTQTFSGRGTQTFTSAGKTITFPITVDSFSGTFQLGDALNSSNSLTLGSGTLDAVTYNVTITTFSAGPAILGTVLKMGSGLWTLSGVGSVWNASTNITLLKGTADILLSSTSTTGRVFFGAGHSYNKLTIGGATGTSTTTIQSNNTFTELASTKTVAHTIGLGTDTQTFGKWSVTGSAGNVVTLTGTGTSHVLAGSCTSGIDYLAMGSIGFSTNSTAEFYAGANSTGTAAAPVYRTAKPADSTRYWVGGTGNWSDTARWSTSSGGSSGASVPRSHDDVVFDSASNATAYTATVNAVTGGIRCKSLTIAPPATGNITLAGSNSIDGIHGNVTLPATGLTRTYTGAITLSGSTTGKTFTQNGVSLASNVTVNGVGCGWTLGSAFSIPTGSAILTVLNGSFDTGNYNVAANRLTSNSSNTRAISLGSSTVTIGGQVQLGTTTNLTFNAGTSQINCDASGADFVSNGLTFYNVSFTANATGTRTIQGSNTFNNLTLRASTSGLSQLSINADQTITGTLACSPSSATARGFIRSDTIGTTRTLTVGTLAADDCDFRDITIAGTAAGTAPTRAGDCGGNSGITFPASKTVYWNLAGSQSWNATAWATSSGGTPAVNNFPLAQDTAVIDNASAVTQISSSVSYNLSTIDLSARTNAMTFGFGASQSIYGSYIFGSGVSMIATGTITFSGRGTMTFTSAGKTITFPITVDAPTGTLQLGDAFTSSNGTNTALYLLSGTFNANDFNVSLTNNSSGVVASVGSAIRTLAFGSGTWTLASANGYVASSANLTVTGNCIINLTSASARTFNGGGLSYSGITLNQGSTGTLTITGNNTFAGITSTATGATTIALGTTTQRVGNFTATGTAGNILTITGNTSNLIYTGSGAITGLDYLNVQGRVYGSAGQITDVWYAGANSVNSGSLGWVFAAGVTPPPSANANFFLMFG